MRFGDALSGARPAKNTSCLKGPLALPFYSTANRKRKEGLSMRSQRHLEDLISIGPAMLRDFQLLGVQSVSQLAKQDPGKMYQRLERLTGLRQDPCVLDTFCAAVAQARNPRLPVEKCQWWYWSGKRKAQLAR